MSDAGAMIRTGFSSTPRVYGCLAAPWTLGIVSNW